MSKLYLLFIEFRLHFINNYKKYIALFFTLLIALFLFKSFTFANSIELKIDDRYYYLTGNTLEVKQENRYYDYAFKYDVFEAYNTDGAISYITQYGSVIKDVYLTESIHKATKQLILDNTPNEFYAIDDDNKLVHIPIDAYVNGQIFKPNPYWYNSFRYIYFPKGSDYIYSIKFINYYFD